MAPDKELTRYRVLFHSDGSHTIEVSLGSIEDAAQAPALAEVIERNIEAYKMVSRIRAACSLVSGAYVLPKKKDTSDQLRLAAMLGAAYPDGMLKSTVKRELGIASSSLDAYVNWETKETSKYINYDKTSKKLFISLDGVEWVCSQLDKRKTKAASAAKKQT